MYNYRYRSSSESDSDGQYSAHPVKTLDWSYQMLDCQTTYSRINNLIEATNGTKKHENIDSLLFVNNILNSIPSNIIKFSNLKILNLSDNNLTHIPESITKFPLTSLIAKNNKITEEGLPKSFDGFKKLNVLNLSGNYLSSFPPQIIAATSLEYLYLGNNSIADMPYEIYRLERLKMLCLGGNKIKEVPISVGYLYNLQGFIISDNLLETLPSSIANLKKLRSLLLHRNRLRMLPTEIITLKCLTELTLRDNPLIRKFVSDLMYTPPTLLELAGRVVKLHELEVKEGDLPESLREYLDSAHHCVNPKCRGVFFDNRVEHVKFADFCGKYHVPLLQYLCSSKCVINNSDLRYTDRDNDELMKRVLLG